MYNRMPYLSDNTIVPRVQKYLESNVDKTYVDINVMADDLQRIYKEYGRRKRSSFRGAVKKAYAIVLQSYGIGENEHQSSSEELSDESIDDPNYPGNTMNNQMMELYSGRSAQKPPVGENELIDISSDDSNDQLPLPPHILNDKPKNGPSTSEKPKLLQFKTPPHHQNERGKKRKSENQAISLTSTPKKKKSIATLQEPNVTFKNIGGLDKVLEVVCKLLIHVRHPEVYRQIGISPPRGFLLHGPPGSGKTLLANAIAGELGVPLLKVAAPELVAGVSGESEERIRELFERATYTSPCVLFIDEIDAITPNRQNAQKEMERRIVAQLLSCMDELNQNENADQVIVIGATNRPDSIDPALRRSGRFDKEVPIGIPDVEARAHILKVLTARLKLSDNFDYTTIAKYSPGFVGADLSSLIREAAMVAVNRAFNDLKEKHKLSNETAIKTPLSEADVHNQSTLILSCKDTSNESDIVVDGEPENKDVAPSGETTADETIVVTEPETPVVVIDDDAKPIPKIQPVDVAQMTEPVDKFEDSIRTSLLKAETPLDELILWLHEQAPLTNEQLIDLEITMEDFAKALRLVQPSAKREGFATVPDVSWDDVGSLGNIREELQLAILAPIRHAEQFKSLGLSGSTGVLLCGPPGCGKTLLAKAIANEAGINFISVKGPELLNMYVGESERAVRLCFERARNSAPCVIFFDELDALCPKRSDSGDGGPTMRVVNQMLTEMDGIEGRQGVYLLAASNRPDIIDPAVLRPGRLDKILYVGLPSANDRVDILRAVTKNGTKPQLASDVNLELIGKSVQCEGYTGADLAALVREAGIQALKEFMISGNTEQPLVITTEHFKRAVAKIRPSVPDKDQKHYEKLKKIYATDRGRAEQGDVEEMEYS